MLGRQGGFMGAVASNVCIARFMWTMGRAAEEIFVAVAADRDTARVLGVFRFSHEICSRQPNG